MAEKTILKLNKLVMEENDLAFSGSSIDKEGGCVGHFRADFDSNGMGFYHSWWPHNDPDDGHAEFSEALKKVVDGFLALLKGSSRSPVDWRRKCRAYCSENLDRNFGDRGYGARADVDGYSFIFRLNPQRGDYDLYVYCYKSESLSMK